MFLKVLYSTLICLCGLAPTLLANDIDIGLSKKTGTITRLGVDNFVSSSEFSPFEIAICDRKRRTITLRANNAQHIKASENNNVETVTYDGFKKGDFKSDFIVTLFVVRNGPIAKFRIEVENTDPNLTIEHVDFRLWLNSQIGESPADDQLFVPRADGVVYYREGLDRLKATTSKRTPQWWVYPGAISMQFMAFFDSDSGVCLRCEDADGGRKSFFAQFKKVTGEGHTPLELGVRHLTPFAFGKSFETPWHVLQSCHSSWEVAAAKYQSWALRQNFATPAPAPKWLNDYPYLITGKIRHSLAGSENDSSILDSWSAYVADWKEQLNGYPVLLDIREWEKLGLYASPDYRPFYPSNEEIKKLNGSLGSSEVRTQPMVSGLKWMIYRSAKSLSGELAEEVDQRDTFEKVGKTVCCIERDGSVRQVAEKKAPNWAGRNSFICPGTSYARRHLVETAKSMSKAGFTVFQVDQNIGGLCPACYSEKHEHVPGPGNWIIRNFCDILGQCREQGRKHNPDFCIGMESCCEYLIPYVDIFYGRLNRGSSRRPGQGIGTLQVPAFKFVFGNRTNIGILGNRLSGHKSVCNEVNLLRPFLSGYRLGGTFFGRTFDEVHTAQQSLVLRATNFYANSISEMIRKGQLVDAYDSLPNRNKSFVYQDGSGKDKQEYTCRNLPFSVWSWKERFGILIANASSSDQVLDQETIAKIEEYQIELWHCVSPREIQKSEKPANLKPGEIYFGLSRSKK